MQPMDYAVGIDLVWFAIEAFINIINIGITICDDT